MRTKILSAFSTLMNNNHTAPFMINMHEIFLELLIFETLKCGPAGTDFLFISEESGLYLHLKEMSGALAGIPVVSTPSLVRELGSVLA